MAASVGIAQHGQTIFRYNYGCKDLKDRQTPDSSTVYGIGSITKSFTATAIAQLVSDGRLCYHKRVKQILPAFKTHNIAVMEQATVMDVLTHRLGLARSDAWWHGAAGQLLLDQRQTLGAIAELRMIYPLRGRFHYSNWNYALAGEIIESITGVSYGQYIAEAATAPLGLRCTTAFHDRIPQTAVAKPYAALDGTGTWAELPRPRAQSGTIMGSALGILSSVDDLLTFSCAVMRGLNSPNLFNNMFADLSLSDASSVLGFFSHQLPGSITTDGINGIFVRQPPKLVPGAGRASLVISQTGSLAGYTSILAMLPEMEASVVVLTNSIGLADPVSWIAHVLVEALVDSPAPVDIMEFVAEAVQGHIQSYPRVLQRFQELRAISRRPAPRDLMEFPGTYRYIGALDFRIVVRLPIGTASTRPHKLQVTFQGRQSQEWDLEHLEGDTFHWLCSRDWQAQRAWLTYPLVEDMFKLIFRRDDCDRVRELIWAHDGEVAHAHQRFVKVFETEADFCRQAWWR